MASAIAQFRVRRSDQFQPPMAWLRQQRDRPPSTATHGFDNTSGLHQLSDMATTTTLVVTAHMAATTCEQAPRPRPAMISASTTAPESERPPACRLRQRRRIGVQPPIHGFTTNSDRNPSQQSLLQHHRWLRRRHTQNRRTTQPPIWLRQIQRAQPHSSHPMASM